MDDLMGPPPPTSTIYISGFGPDTKEATLLKHFSQVGVIKKDKTTGAPQIYLYKDEDGV
jgi:RNA recognition motif-containing protein